MGSRILFLIVAGLVLATGLIIGGGGRSEPAALAQQEALRDFDVRKIKPETIDILFESGVLSSRRRPSAGVTARDTQLFSDLDKLVVWFVDKFQSMPLSAEQLQKIEQIKIAMSNHIEAMRAGVNGGNMRSVRQNLDPKTNDILFSLEKALRAKIGDMANIDLSGSEAEAEKGLFRYLRDKHPQLDNLSIYERVKGGADSFFGRIVKEATKELNLLEEARKALRPGGGGISKLRELFPPPAITVPRGPKPKSTDPQIKRQRILLQNDINCLSKRGPLYSYYLPRGQEKELQAIIDEAARLRKLDELKYLEAAAGFLVKEVAIARAAELLDVSPEKIRKTGASLETLNAWLVGTGYYKQQTKTKGFIFIRSNPRKTRPLPGSVAALAEAAKWGKFVKFTKAAAGVGVFLYVLFPDFFPDFFGTGEPPPVFGGETDIKYFLED